MLRNLFTRKPRLDAADPDQRIAALGALVDDQDAFRRLLQEDPERSVRLAALARITRPESLVDSLCDAELGEQATARLLTLIDDTTPAEIRDHEAVRRAAVVHAATADAAVAAAARIADLAERAAALADNPRASVRVEVAEATWDPTLLTEFEKLARGRDKSVHRVASDRLAELKAHSEQRERQALETDALVAAAQALADDDAYYEARRSVIERDWNRHLEAVRQTDQALAPFGMVERDTAAMQCRLAPRRPPPKPVSHSLAEFEPLRADAHALRQHAAEAVAEALAVAPSAHAAARREEAAASVAARAEQLALRFSALSDQQPPGDDLVAEFRASLADVDGQIERLRQTLPLLAEANELLQQAIPEQPAEAGPLDVVQREVARQRSLAQRLCDRYRWPEGLTAPAELAALTQRLADLDEVDARVAAQGAERADVVGVLLGELRASVEAGNATQAVAQERRLRDLASALPRAHAESLHGALADVGAKVRELRAWRTYAEVPKREALCEQLEELAANPLPVRDQADAVKTLRAQWNALGAVSSRQERDLRKRFDKAAEQAFEPCRVYFKEQAGRRAFNLEQRQAIVAALDSYVENNDWDNADWRGADKVLRQARAEWRHYHPVDREAGRELAARFEALAERLHGLLKAEWERNVASKEALLDEAQAVRESNSPATEKADAMKTLQRRWRDAGPVPYRVDQRLWKAFRAECDAVFEARNVVRDRHGQRRRLVEDAESLLAELERRMDLDPTLRRETVADYEQRLPEREALPKALARRIETTLQEADRLVVERAARNADRADEA